MKKNYKKPILETVEFNKCDVITTSGIDLWNGGSGEGVDTDIDWKD